MIGVGAVGAVAYRLFTETDIPGWWRTRCVRSAGSKRMPTGWVSASTIDPSDDLAVAGVAALYAPADLALQYDATGQATSCCPDDPQPAWDAPTPPWMARLFGPDADRFRLHLIPFAGRFDWLIGGTPDEMPERFALLSPLHRVHGGCPPTLLVHGERDQMAPIADTRALQRRLRNAGVPVAAAYLPHTDHAFDLIAPQWAPPARVAVHVLDRFLEGVGVGAVGPHGAVSSVS